MAKKLTELQQRAQAEDMVNVLKKTSTKDVTFKADGKTYTIAGVRLNYGIVKKLTFKDENEIMGAFQQLWENQIAKSEGAEAALDEMDWDDATELFSEWFSPIDEAGAELEKKYS